MKQGFELIKSREYNYESEIATMEKDFSLTLPPLFKLFATYFELGSCCTEKYLAKRENSYYPPPRRICNSAAVSISICNAKK